MRLTCFWNSREYKLVFLARLYRSRDLSWCSAARARQLYKRDKWNGNGFSCRFAPKNVLILDWLISLWGFSSVQSPVSTVFTWRALPEHHSQDTFHFPVALLILKLFNSEAFLAVLHFDRLNLFQILFNNFATTKSNDYIFCEFYESWVLNLIRLNINTRVF